MVRVRGGSRLLSSHILMIHWVGRVDRPARTLSLQRSMALSGSPLGEPGTAIPRCAARVKIGTRVLGPQRSTAFVKFRRATVPPATGTASPAPARVWTCTCLRGSISGEPPSRPVVICGQCGPGRRGCWVLIGHYSTIIYISAYIRAPVRIRGLDTSLERVLD